MNSYLGVRSGLVIQGVLVYRDRVHRVDRLMRQLTQTVGLQSISQIKHYNDDETCQRLCAETYRVERKHKFPSNLLPSMFSPIKQ